MRAFLGMKLRRNDIAAGERGGEGLDVIGITQGQGRVLRHDVIAVHKIKARVARDAVGDRMIACPRHLVPAHVRDLARAAIGGPRRMIGKAPHLPRKDVETGGATIFGAVGDQRLQA